METSADNYFQQLELGVSLPFNNPHAVSVHLATLDDVIGYEENHPQVVGRMQSGYPRFFTNKLVQRLMDYARDHFDLPESVDLFPVMNRHAVELLRQNFHRSIPYVEVKDCFFVAVERKDAQYKSMKDFIRYSGLFLSSRKAEDALFSLGLAVIIHAEQTLPDGYSFIQKELAIAYNCPNETDVMLSSCGMNAIYAVMQSLQSVTRNQNRKDVLQLGCLYVDSEQMIDENNNDKLLVPIASDMDAVERFLAEKHSSIMAVFTEVPNNPVLDCADIPKLSRLCNKYNIALVVDATFGTPYNVDILPWCDVVVESLTKFACGHGDTIMGAAILNSNSAWYSELKSLLKNNIVDPYHRDSGRLAIGIANYQERMLKVAESTIRLINYFEQSPAIQKVFSCIPEGHHFHNIKRTDGSMPGLVSVIFNSPLERHYNQLPFAKGPSLGTNFTLLMPYVYMAHYPLVKTEKGRKELARMGMHPDMLRFSVGLEPVEDIIANLQKAGI